MLETLARWKKRKFRTGSYPTNAEIISEIEAGRYYGEQIAGRWYIDETVTVVRTTRPAPVDTGDDIADRILREINHGR